MFVIFNRIWRMWKVRLLFYVWVSEKLFLNLYIHLYFHIGGKTMSFRSLTLIALVQHAMELLVITYVQHDFVNEYETIRYDIFWEVYMCMLTNDYLKLIFISRNTFIRFCHRGFPIERRESELLLPESLSICSSQHWHWLINTYRVHDHFKGDLSNYLPYLPMECTFTCVKMSLWVFIICTLVHVLMP